MSGDNMLRDIDRSWAALKVQRVFGEIVANHPELDSDTIVDDHIKRLTGDYPWLAFDASMRDVLDAFRVEVGDENFRVIAQGASLASMLEEFKKRTRAKLLDIICRGLCDLAEKYQPDHGLTERDVLLCFENHVGESLP